jgi:hypothetical protein
VYRCRFVCPISQLTDDYCRVTVFGCLDPDPSKVVILDIIKLCFMMLEIKACEDYCLSDIIIMDFNNFTVGHIAKVTLPLLKKVEVCALVSLSRHVDFFHLIRCLVGAQTW